MTYASAHPTEYWANCVHCQVFIVRQHGVASWWDEDSDECEDSPTGKHEPDKSQSVWR
jgi:hypothetical protein